jgi:hypothetical protein
VNGCQNPCKDGGTKKTGMILAHGQPLLAVDRLPLGMDSGQYPNAVKGLDQFTTLERYGR